MTDGSQINLAPLGRRDPTPPLKRGVTLVELMISMLILAIVCIAWLQIIGIQSARKEARRREAVERLVGMMDAFMRVKYPTFEKGCYHVYHTNNVCHMELGRESKIDFNIDDGTVIHPVFANDVSAIGYQFCVVDKTNLGKQDKKFVRWEKFTGWDKTDRDHPYRYWLVGMLYDRSGNVEEVGKPFFTLPVCLGL